MFVLEDGKEGDVGRRRPARRSRRSLAGSRRTTSRTQGTRPRAAPRRVRLRVILRRIFSCPFPSYPNAAVLRTAGAPTEESAAGEILARAHRRPRRDGDIHPSKKLFFSLPVLRNPQRLGRRVDRDERARLRRAPRAARSRTRTSGRRGAFANSRRRSRSSYGAETSTSATWPVGESSSGEYVWTR